MSWTATPALFLAAAAATPGPAALPMLSWTGAARVHAPGRVIDIRVETEVQPFRAARSRSWIIAEGPTRARTMVLNGDQGFTIFGDRRSAMTPAEIRHERMQFALYGLMLTTRGRGRYVLARHEDAPDTTLCFDRAGRLRSGSNTVPDAQTGAPLAQTFEFFGEVRSNGLTWPRTLRILHDGKPYFELEIESFAAACLQVPAESTSQPEPWLPLPNGRLKRRNGAQCRGSRLGH